MAALERGVERHLVRGGGSIVLEVDAGDRVELVDPEGGQVADLVLFAPDGRADPGALGLRADREPAALREMLAKSDEGAQRVRAALARRGLDLGRARATALFASDSGPDESVELRAVRDCVLIVAAPGAAMTVWEQTPPTDLLVFVTRATVKPAGSMRLPEPLAEPRLEMRIEAASTDTYEVFAGEYVQIIDIQGRQCSDFLAFARRPLDGGRVRGLDGTTTHTLIGAAYPQPGLLSKFFDEDMQPLVEVVQDTVGRHDTFNLACTERYYEDQGYFGHRACSTNFNASLAPYQIPGRRGWPAINLFYNTWVDAQHQLHLDVPWSRPGDYVLLRALTDLVCASSACPDDIDAANGWFLSDIHVRVYAASSVFKRAVHFRMTPEAPTQLTRETGFHPRVAALTRNLVEYRGYWLPTCFNNFGPEQEYWACRERVAVMDLSPLRKLEVLGPDAETLMQRTLTRNVRRLAPGHVVYSAMCYEHGGMLDDGTLFRLGPDNFRWIGGDAYDGVWLRDKAKEWGLQVSVKSATEQIHNVAVQGPSSRELLRELIWTPPARPTVEELGWFRFTIGRIGGYDGIPVLVSRTGYTGELGYEVFCHPDQALAVWDAVFAAGEPHGVTPLGLSALDMLRIEAGLVFFGYEFDDQTDPFEAGIGFAVALKNDEDFVGRTALERRKASPQRRLVGLELTGNEPAAHGDCVHIGRKQVGLVTSATRSPVLRKNIALARLSTEYAELGTEVEIGKLDGHEKRLPATLVRFPFYDPDKSRVRA